MIIDGKTIAEELLILLRQKISHTSKRFLGAAVVGEDSASLHFLAQKEKAAKEAGIEFRLYKFPYSISEAELKEAIQKILEDPSCGGFLVQLPLPLEIDREEILNLIPREKDVDLLSKESADAFYQGDFSLKMPSVLTVEEVLRRGGILDLASKKIAVIGAGSLIGKPVARALLGRVDALKVFTSQTENLRTQLKDFDVIISGAGEPHLFAASDLKEGALVIDFGYGKIDGKIAGDFDPFGAEENKVSYTRTPGGTGPILVAKLLENFFALNAK